MNRINEMSRNVRNKFYGVQGALAAGLALSPALAFAQTGPDTSSITTELGTYKTAVVALVIAFAVVLWAVKGAGLLKPRG